jgi:hypothetical protein
MQTTIWDVRAYDAGLREAMRKIIDEYTLSYPGIKKVEHELSTPFMVPTTTRDAGTSNGHGHSGTSSGASIATYREHAADGASSAADAER